MYGGYYGYPEIAAELRKAQVEHVAKVLAAVGSKATDAGVPCDDLSPEGLRGQEICSAARERDARLLVSAPTVGTASAG